MAGEFYFFHPDDNVAPDATMSVGVGTGDPAYPAANAVDLSFAKLADPAGLTGVTGAWDGAFTGAQRVDLVVLWHNLDPGLAVSFKMNATNVWTSPTVNEAFTIPAKRADGFTRKVFLDLRDATGYSTGGFQYFRLHVSGTNSVPIGIKLLLFSGVRQLSRDFQWGVEDIEHRLGIDMMTDAGQPWAYDLAAAPRLLKGSAILSDSDAETVREWLRAAARSPIVIIPEPTGNDAWLCRRSSGSFSIGAPALTVLPHSTTRQYTDANVCALAFEELTAGDPEWS